MAYIFGIGLLIGMTRVIWSIHRRMTTGSMIVVEKTGWWIFTKKKWQFKEASVKDDEAKSVILVVSWVAQVLMLVITIMIIFR
jgi:hypothetical protein